MVVFLFVKASGCMSGIHWKGARGKTGVPLRKAVAFILRCRCSDWSSAGEWKEACECEIYLGADPEGFPGGLAVKGNGEEVLDLSSGCAGAAY